MGERSRDRSILKKSFQNPHLIRTMKIRAVPEAGDNGELFAKNLTYLET